jgi:hypothetical protein
MEKLLRPKELCAALQRSRTYLWCMKRLGFRMPGGTATLTEARDFLARVPFPMRARNRAQPGKTDDGLKRSGHR